MMSVYEQTVVVLARATAFTVVCQACAELEPGAEYTGLTAQGTLRLEHDVGWTTCPRGHRIRVIRAGAGVAAEATTPLW
jgi:hypothetical protein